MEMKSDETMRLGDKKQNGNMWIEKKKGECGKVKNQTALYGRMCDSTECSIVSSLLFCYILK